MSEDGEDEFEEEEEPTTNPAHSDNDEDNDFVTILPFVELLQDLPIVEPLPQPASPAHHAQATNALNSPTFDAELAFPDELAFLI